MTTDAPAVQYVWSRFTARPVEHLTLDERTLQPLCGARLDPERLTYRDRPSGLAPICTRCQARHAKGRA